MDKNPLISVILPAYNAEKYIEQAINSIINQTYKNWELLIADDASTDKTKEIIDALALRDSRIRLFHNKLNLKLLKTRNKLIRYIKGDFITFQDADDYSDLNRLELLIKEFLSNDKLGLVSSQVGYVDQNGNLLRVSNKPTTYMEVMNKIYNQNVIGGSIMAIRKEALNKVGGKFREFFDGLSNQDYDLSFLIAQKYETYNLPHILYFYRQHLNSNSKILDIDRLLAKDVVIHLGKQRKDRGSDDLIDGNSELVDRYVELLKIPYLEDPSLIYRNFASIYMYNDFFIKAIKTSWTAVIAKPFKLVNWTTLQYCIRISILKLFVRAY